ncbi:hypothetical protein B0H13DRAFT_1911122 [Mycena leptocephala]|nr:hypothetical protein B0H13DRAFT_1911122 [Mycena leptocephala]
MAILDLERLLLEGEPGAHHPRYDILWTVLLAAHIGYPARVFRVISYAVSSACLYSWLLMSCKINVVGRWDGVVIEDWTMDERRPRWCASGRQEIRVAPTRRLGLPTSISLRWLAFIFRMVDFKPSSTLPGPILILIFCRAVAENYPGTLDLSYRSLGGCLRLFPSQIRSPLHNNPSSSPISKDDLFFSIPFVADGPRALWEASALVAGCHDSICGLGGAYLVTNDGRVLDQTSYSSSDVVLGFWPSCLLNCSVLKFDFPVDMHITGRLRIHQHHLLRFLFTTQVRAHCVSSPLDSTYGVLLVSLFLKTILYGVGVLQTWIYFASLPADAASVKWTVLVVLCDMRYLKYSLQLLAALPHSLLHCNVSHPGAASNLQTNQRRKIQAFRSRHINHYLTAWVGCRADSYVFWFNSVAGIAQTVLSYEVRSFKLGKTKRSEGRNPENEFNDGHAHPPRYKSRHVGDAVFGCQHGAGKAPPHYNLGMFTDRPEFQVLPNMFWVFLELAQVVNSQQMPAHPGQDCLERKWVGFDPDESEQHPPQEFKDKHPSLPSTSKQLLYGILWSR